MDDKYQYSLENKDNQVHGWISFDPPVGFWQITPSNEFRTGGPFKQDLTSHVNPTTLAVSSYHANVCSIIDSFREKYAFSSFVILSILYSGWRAIKGIQ